MLADEPFTMEEAEANDRRQMVIGIVYMLAYLTTAFLFLRWTYLANRNARALGAENMEYSPGKAVGWYFVPIATFWKPYQAMVEIFKASHPRHDDDWSLAERPAIVPLWWTLWIAATFLGQAVFRTTLRAEEIDEFLTSSTLTRTGMTVLPSAFSALNSASSVRYLTKMIVGKLTGNSAFQLEVRTSPSTDSPTLWPSP